MGIRDNLLEVINGESVNKWAEDHGLPPQTVHEWLKKDRTPRSANFDVLINSTGIPKEWWLRGKGPPPLSTQHTREPSKPQVSRSEKPNHRRFDDYQPGSFADFILVPEYDVRASAGGGSLNQSEQIVGHLAFKKRWVTTVLCCNPKDLVLITVKGDSMEPTLSSNDLILVNTSRNQITDNAVYVLQHEGALLVKRIQRKMNGVVLIKSDNPEYENEELDASQAQLLHVLGIVEWYGRRM